MSVVNGISKSWLDTELIPKLKIYFGKEGVPMKCEISSPPDCFFLSRVFLLDLKFYTNEEKNQLSCEYNLVVKLPTTKKIIFDTLKMDYTFYNEILFYTKYAKNSEDYPRCFYTLYKPQYDSTIITENIIKQGYQMHPRKNNISMKYVLAAVKKMGRFHAKGYIFKENHPDEFFDIVKCIRSDLYEKDDKFSQRFYINVMGLRMANYLRHHDVNNRKFDDLLFGKMEPYLMNAYEKIVIKLMKPVEPLAILCHGDFVINNVFFKEMNQKIEAKIFDFGKIGFLSPSHDLATFLILNCTKEARTSQFNDIFSAYHESLMQCLKEAMISNLERFSREKFLEDYKAHSLGTFLRVAFFLLTTLNYPHPDLLTLWSMSEEDGSEYYLHVGGDEFSKLIIDILLDLCKVGCLDFILKARIKMGALNESTKVWLEEQLIPQLRISLKRSNPVVSYKVFTPQDTFFLSRVFFLDLKFAENQEKREFNLVVKQPATLKTINEELKVELAFRKEILFYKKYSKNNPDYPQCVYTLEKPPYDSLIVLENITKQGYQICSEKVNLKMEFVVAAVQEIGRFHAKAYIFKDKHPEEFFNIVKKIQDIDQSTSQKIPLPIIAANAIGVRVMEYLRRENYDKEFCNKIEPFLVNVFDNIVKKTKKPTEPLVTLCHGDFVRHNILYRKIDNMIQAKLIDFGSIEYNSPAKDLSMFFILNCTREIRTSKLNEILDLYLETLIECLKEAGLSNLERFSRKNFLEEYRAHALCNYVLVAFFFHRLYDCDMPSAEAVLISSEKKIFSVYYQIGGDELTKIFVGILEDLRETGCLDLILE